MYVQVSATTDFDSVVESSDSIQRDASELPLLHLLLRC